MRGESHVKKIMGETNIGTLFYHLRKQKSSDLKKFPYSRKTCSLYAAQVSAPLGNLSGSDGPLAFMQRWEALVSENEHISTQGLFEVRLKNTF